MSKICFLFYILTQFLPVSTRLSGKTGRTRMSEMIAWFLSTESTSKLLSHTLMKGSGQGVGSPLNLRGLVSDTKSAWPFWLATLSGSTDHLLAEYGPTGKFSVKLILHQTLTNMKGLKLMTGTNMVTPNLWSQSQGYFMEIIPLEILWERAKRQWTSASNNLALFLPFSVMVQQNMESFLILLLSLLRCRLTEGKFFFRLTMMSITTAINWQSTKNEGRDEAREVDDKMKNSSTERVSYFFNVNNKMIFI